MTDQLGPDRPFRLLTLDGGGAKGFYTLGVLAELEALAGTPLHSQFDLIFGTSTGSIIAALLARGESVARIHQLYQDNVPKIMGLWLKHRRSRALHSLATEVFGNATFSTVKTPLAIVTARWDLETPKVFKSHPQFAHGLASSFVPGFGCTIADAVEASCSAYPFFNRKSITTPSGDHFELIDGGYCANNPTLFALASALKALESQPRPIKVLSVGVGQYPERERFIYWVMSRMPLLLIQKTLNINSLSMERLRQILFRDIETVRISDSYESRELATDLMETRPKVLSQLHQLGRASFGNKETAVATLLALPKRAH
jgi:patatin-like phospholipase/acyl hydrolase